jgi:hypothetical protein
MYISSCTGDHWSKNTESGLSASALESEDLLDFGELVVFGGDVMVPGVGFDSLICEASRGKQLFGVGITLTHDSVSQVHHEVRARVGGVLQMLSKVYVTDRLSVEWAPHYAVDVELGHHIGWLAPPSRCCDVPLDGIVRTVAQAISCAISRRPMLLVPETGSGQHQQGGYHPLIRWAHRYEMSRVLCVSMEEAQRRQSEDGLVKFDSSRLDAIRYETRAMLHSLEHKPVVSTPVRAEFDLADAAADTMSAVSAAVGSQPAGMPRKFDLGVTFDPSTHYDEYYYDADGPGIEFFHKGTGGWEIYHGTAAHWDGNRIIAKILDDILTGTGVDPKTLMDIGCGPGDFLGQMINLGWFAHGADISERAREKASPSIREFIHVVDLSKAGANDHRSYSVVTAFDFWEHIFTEDVDALIDGVRDLLPVGGIHLAVVCTHGTWEGGFVANPGVVTDRDNSWALVSGHVNIRRWGWWVRRFKKHGFVPRHNIMSLFQVRREETLELRETLAWGARQFIAMQKV